MKVGIVGLGKRLAYLARVFPAVDPEFRIVGYADPEPFGLDYVRQHGIGVGRHHDSLARLLAAERLDLLMIGSPNHLHLEQVAEALPYGMPIFCEKPVVATEEQTYEMLRLLADGADARVLVGLVLRYTTLYEDTMAAIRDGTIGEISSIEASEHIKPYHGAFFMRDWRRYEAYAGSYLLEKCCHDLDIYRGMVGSRPARVASFGGRRSFIPRLGNLEDREIHHSKPAGWNGATAVFDSDADIVDCQAAIIEYASGAAMTFHTNINVPDEFRRFCIIGSHGMAEGDFVRNFLRIHETPSGALLVERSCYERTELGMHYGGEERMVADILRYIRNEGPLPVSVHDALEAGLTAMKIDEARRTRSVIDLAETWRRFDEARGANGAPVVDSADR
jgi:predicted dehydrogenase